MRWVSWLEDLMWDTRERDARSPVRLGELLAPLTPISTFRGTSKDSENFRNCRENNCFTEFKHSRDLVLMANDTTLRILKELAWEQSGFSVTATQERRWDSSESYFSDKEMKSLWFTSVMMLYTLLFIHSCISQCHFNKNLLKVNKHLVKILELSSREEGETKYLEFFFKPPGFTHRFFSLPW